MSKIIHYVDNKLFNVRVSLSAAAVTNSGRTGTEEQCECILHDKAMSTPDGRITNELKRGKSLSAVGLRHTGTGASGMLDVQCTCSVYDFDFVCVSRFGNIRSLCVRV